jgi:outer membrane cobalamin receptor
MKHGIPLFTAGQRLALDASLLATAVTLTLQPTRTLGQDAPQSRLDEVIVSASAMPLEAAKVGSAVSVITADDLEIQ